MSKETKSLERSMCQDDIKMILLKINFHEVINWLNVLQNSGQWRAVVNTAMNLNVP
jgi:hypothetical protein